MKLSFAPAAAHAAAVTAAFAAVLSLSACGGGGDSGDSGNSGNNAVVNNPAALTKTDLAIGTGAEAVNGARVQVNYTGWLYNASAAATGFKGTKFDASAAGKPFTFVIGATGTAESVIPGFSQGVLGMKVGGKRTVLVPASLGYGSGGITGTIPANNGLVFDVELVKVCGAAAC
jgi:FKBP-type peptidyl-prolyl cis-trans isomerase FkpA